MTGINTHKERIKEHLTEINGAIDEGIEKKPVTIGFHCSACAMEMLELYLHVTSKITPGKMVKHEWFKRPVQGQKSPPMIEKNLPVSLEKKAEIYELIYKIEEKRNKLIYGGNYPSDTKIVLESFVRLKDILKGILLEEGIDVEQG